MVATWTIIVACWALACWVLWRVHGLDNPPTAATITATLGGAGAIGLTALPIAAAGNATGAGVIGAGLLLSAVACPLLWLLLTKPRGFVRPDHGHPQFATEAAAVPPPVQRDPGRYRVKSAAEALAEAQGAGAFPAATRSARVRRIIDMEV